MTEISCRAFLFDLDGVLVDSTPAVARVWSKWAVAHGFDPVQVTHHAQGRPSIATIRELLPNAEAEKENAFVERAEIEDLDGVVPLPGAAELLRALPADRWTIVTSCTRRLAEVRILAAGLRVPEKIITSNDITRGKPDPEPYVKGAAKLGIYPSDCVVVEDALAGVLAGKAAGARVLALRTTSPEPELLDAGADWIADDLASVVLQPAAPEAPLRFSLRA